MSEPSPSNDPQLREELVAYLDGELDSQGSQRIEELLARDGEVRKLLHSLEQSWQLLDALDAPVVGDNFTQTTLEMVAVAAAADADSTTPSPRRRRWRALLAVESVMLAAAAAFAITAATLPDPNRQLLQDLPMLQDLEHLREVDDIKFLRTLEREKLFAEDTDDGQ